MRCMPDLNTLRKKTRHVLPDKLAHVARKKSTSCVARQACTRCEQKSTSCVARQPCARCKKSKACYKRRRAMRCPTGHAHDAKASGLVQEKWLRVMRCPTGPAQLSLWRCRSQCSRADMNAASLKSLPGGLNPSAMRPHIQ